MPQRAFREDEAGGEALGLGGLEHVGQVVGGGHGALLGWLLPAACDGRRWKSSVARRSPGMSVTLVTGRMKTAIVTRWSQQPAAGWRGPASARAGAGGPGRCNSGGRLRGRPSCASRPSGARSSRRRRTSSTTTSRKAARFCCMRRRSSKSSSLVARSAGEISPPSAAGGSTGRANDGPVRDTSERDDIHGSSPTSTAPRSASDLARRRFRAQAGAMVDLGDIACGVGVPAVPALPAYRAALVLVAAACSLILL